MLLCESVLCLLLLQYVHIAYWLASIVEDYLVAALVMFTSVQVKPTCASTS